MNTAVRKVPSVLDGGIPTQSVKRFSLAEYHRLAELGILKPSERIELLEGWLVTKVTHNPPHDATVSVAFRRLLRVLPEEWIIRIQSSVTLPKDSEPEPDLAIVRGPEDRYLSRHPLPKDIGLLIEVADASLGEDRGVKLALYARDRIPVYWIINLIDDQIEAHARPRSGAKPMYRERTVYQPGDSIPFVVSNKVVSSIPVRELLPEFQR